MIMDFWRGHVGAQRAIPLENSDDVAETMAMIIGLNERTINLESGLDHLRASGAGQQTLDALARALRLLDGDAVQGAGSPLRDLDDPSSGVRRLN